MKNSKRKVVEVEIGDGNTVRIVRTNDKGKRVPKPSVLLQRSLDLLDRGRRWIKDSFVKGVGEQVDFNIGQKHIERILTKESYCMLGACQKVNTLNQVAATEILRLCLPSDYASVPDFNDDEDTTYAGVAKVFRKAIKVAKAAHA